MNECPECKGKGYTDGHGAFGEYESWPCYRCIHVKKTITEVRKILDSEPLGYKTEREHELLEDYIRRIEIKIQQIR